MLKPFDWMNVPSFVFLRAKFRSKNSSVYSCAVLGYKPNRVNERSYLWAPADPPSMDYPMDYSTEYSIIFRVKIYI